MLHTVLGTLSPIVVTILLGSVAAWHHDFEKRQASTLNRMVLLDAAPMSLFTGTVSIQRELLSQDIPLVIALCAAIIGVYAVVFLLTRFAFRAQNGFSAQAALGASAPAVPFIGPAVLGELFGTASAVPIGIASLIINLTVVPVTVLLLTLDEKQQPEQVENPSTTKSASSRFGVFALTLLKTARQPIVWASAAAFVMVLAGIHIPAVLVHSLSLLGQATGGVALFASGLFLASSPIRVSRSVLTVVALKNIMQPALVLAAMQAAAYRDPIVSEAVLTTAIPVMPIVIMLATQYRVAQAESASEVFFSTIGSVITMGPFIALTS
jgi:malonate transporter and related proteins